ncbi:M14 family zinc carboxypeptidase [Kytococcus sedentarius]|uniref:M14 family zinc carboxypeptidase n=1 Tax=Kytococcus sedentarius TaxID=1276 RepID=UPI001950207A|nr:M14 family zinc carboxypeptidase [Kytococcus sedentarius]QRO87442.1 peptidase M14 [Kytococcus sedentarius]
MHRSTHRAVGGSTLALALCASLALPAGSAPLERSSGPTASPASPATSSLQGESCNDNTGDTGSDSWLSHAELGDRLHRLERQTRGTVQVDTIGQSNQGRDVWSARVGQGDKVILLQSEIHGNEKTGTHALLSLLKEASKNSPQAKELREQVTIVAVPQLNPDASELDRRANDRTWDEVVADFPQLAGANAPWNYYTQPRQGDDYASQPGFDVNRDFHPDLDYVPSAQDFPGTSADPGWYIHPESQNIRDLYTDLQSEFGAVDTFVDLHHQGPCYLVGDTGEEVTLSLSGKFVDIENHAQYDKGYDLEYSKRLNVAALDALQARGNSPFGNISLYEQEIDLPGTALGSFALNGSGTVLFEVRGQTQSWGAKKKGQLVKAVETGLMGIVTSVADDSVTELDPTRYDDIPPTTYPRS